MNNAMRNNIIAGLLLMGGAASCFNWHLAAPLIAAWAFLFILRWTEFQQLVRLILMLTVSQSIYSILMVCAPKIPLSASLACSILFIITGLFFLFKKTACQWPLICGLCGLVLLLASGVHIGLNTILEKPIVPTAWTSPTWAAIAFTLAFIVINQETTQHAIKKWWYAFPVFIALVITAHTLQTQRLEFRLSNESNPGAIAEIAFNKGYDQLGVQAALFETERRLATQTIGDAVRYMRHQWKHADKTRFISQYRSENSGTAHPVYFFLTTCFGVQLVLNKDEFVIDGAVCNEPQAIYVLTSQNRLLAIMPKEIKTFPLVLQDAKAISTSAYGVSVLCASQVVITNHQLQKETFSINQADIACDISISDNGEHCFVLLGTGQVDEYVRDLNNAWAFVQTRCNALWKEPDAAVALFMTDDDGAYILTKNGGVHYHDSSIYNRELSPFWDPNRAAMRDFAWEPQSNQMLLMDNFGRLDFVDLNHVPTAEQPVASGWPSVPAEIQFDRENAVWSGAPNRVALEVVVGADTTLQFLRNGFIQAIALPQGARVHYRRGELKLNTRNLE